VAPREPPPMQSAPVPRIEPVDRAIHLADEPEPIAPVVEVPQPVVALAPSPSGVSRQDLSKLRAALSELTECRKLLDAAVMRE